MKAALYERDQTITMGDCEPVPAGPGRGAIAGLALWNLRH